MNKECLNWFFLQFYQVRCTVVEDLAFLENIYLCLWIDYIVTKSVGNQSGEPGTVEQSAQPKRSEEKD